jgi:hypothetical protein
MLLDPHPEPWFGSWRDAHVGALHAAFGEHPIWAAIAGNAFSPGWAADFLCLPPLAPNWELEAELEPMLAFGDERIRGDLAFIRTPLQAGLGATGLAAHAADPADASRSARCRPTKPVPPVIAILMRALSHPI